MNSPSQMYENQYRRRNLMKGRWEDYRSPPFHPGYDTPEGLLRKLSTIRADLGGKAIETKMEKVG